MKDILYVIALTVIVFCISLAIGLVADNKNDSVAQATFDQEIPNDNVHVVYFRDSATDLCYAFISGQVIFKPNREYWSTNIVVVPCDKAMENEDESKEY